MKGRINALFGPEKAGKSRLLGWLLASGFVGKPRTLSMPLRPEGIPKRWLYLAGEEPLETVIGRMKQYIGLLGGDSRMMLPMRLVEAAGMRLDTQVQRSALEQILLRESFDVLVIEPLRRVHGGDEDSNTQMAALHNDLRRWSNGLGVTIVLVHHTGKLSEYADMNRIATWSRGCTDLAAIVDTAAFLEQTGQRETGERLLRLVRAGRFSPVPQLSLVDTGDPVDGGHGFHLGVMR